MNNRYLILFYFLLAVMVKAMDIGEASYQILEKRDENDSPRNSARHEWHRMAVSLLPTPKRRLEDL
jgi:hypothetical protein